MLGSDGPRLRSRRAMSRCAGRGESESRQPQTLKRRLIFDRAVTKNQSQDVVEPRVGSDEVIAPCQRATARLHLDSIETTRMQESQIAGTGRTQRPEHCEPAREKVSGGAEFAQGADGGGAETQASVGGFVLGLGIGAFTNLRAVDGPPTSDDWTSAPLSPACHGRIIGHLRGPGNAQTARRETEGPPRGRGDARRDDERVAAVNPFGRASTSKGGRSESLTIRNSKTRAARKTRCRNWVFREPVSG